MDPTLMGIFLFVMAILLVVLPFAYVVNRREQLHKERKLELEVRAQEARSGRASPEYRKLEERVRVLERIATDRGADLALEIEALRENHSIEDSDSGTAMTFEKRESA